VVATAPTRPGPALAATQPGHRCAVGEVQVCGQEGLAQHVVSVHEGERVGVAQVHLQARADGRARHDHLRCSEGIDVSDRDAAHLVTRCPGGDVLVAEERGLEGVGHVGNAVTQTGLPYAERECGQD
jgi:hypothetical protein